LWEAEGCFRDWLFRSLGIDRKAPLKAVMVDTLAFVLFQVPLYVLVLLFAGDRSSYPRPS